MLRMRAYTPWRDAFSMKARAGGAAMQLDGRRVTICSKQPDSRWPLALEAKTLSAAGI